MGTTTTWEGFSSCGLGVVEVTDVELAFLDFGR